MVTASTADDARGMSVLAERYRLDRIVGRGGMATVYLAHDLALGRDVAAKVFAEGSADDATERRRQDEMRLLARLDHPGLVTLYDCVTGPGHSTALIMQYVDGDDLSEILRSGPLPPQRVAALGAAMADALAYLAAQGIVHRDVKPANIILARDSAGVSRALLTDFGIARLVDSTSVTATGTVIGTMSYLSPEQALGQSVGPETDVYSLGLVLIEALTGERCFPGTGAESIAGRVSRDPDIPASLGEDWTRILSAMTTRSPSERISADAAAALLHQQAGSAAPPDPTLVLPAADDQPTERFGAAKAITIESPGGAVSPRAPGPARPLVRRIALWAVVAVLLLAGILTAIRLAGQAADPVDAPVGTETPAPDTDTDPDYPEVDGDLGLRLKQLEDLVEPDTLQNLVLATAQASADGDYSDALLHLDELESELAAALDRNEVTDARGESIITTIALVREELDSLLDDDKPGNGNGNGNGKDKDKDD